MNIQHFEQCAKDCQKINAALHHLPHFSSDAVFAAWEVGRVFLPAWKEGRLFDWWMNVAAHMSVAAVLGSKLAGMFKKELVHECLTQNDITDALLVHDWSKRLEAKLSSSEHGDVKYALSFEAENKRTLLKWFPNRVVTLTFATGDSGVRITETRQFTLGEKIVFYCDYCTSGSRIVPFKQRLVELLPHFAKGGRYAHPDTYYRERYGMSHNEKIMQLLSPIEAEFMERVDCAKENFPTGLVPVEFCV